MREMSTSAWGRRADGWARMALGALCVALAAACASSRPRPLPPVTETPTGIVTPGKFVWVDLVTDDVAGARNFYGQLFGWSFDGSDGKDGYVRVLQDGAPIGGMVSIERPEGEARESAWVGNLSVADVDEAAALVKRKGGSVARGPVDAPERGRIALVSDPAGAEVLLVRASGGDPPDASPTTGRWLWRELWTHDTEGASAFYAELVGYESDTVDIKGGNYRIFKQGGVPRAGLRTAPDDVEPQWLPYVKVEDPAATAARASKLGGRIVAQDVDAAILVDPGGAAIGLQKWDEEDAEQAR